MATRPEQVESALALREEVFCGEQGVALSAERDGRESEAVHLLAVRGGETVGTCRLLLRDRAALLGRMAVSAHWRRQGIGAELLRAAESEAADRGAEVMQLHAQTHARGLYEAAGYAEVGGYFLEECIEHVAMEKPLA